MRASRDRARQRKRGARQYAVAGKLVQGASTSACRWWPSRQRLRRQPCKDVGAIHRSPGPWQTRHREQRREQPPRPRAAGARQRKTRPRLPWPPSANRHHRREHDGRRRSRVRAGGHASRIRRGQLAAIVARGRQSAHPSPPRTQDAVTVEDSGQGHAAPRGRGEARAKAASKKSRPATGT